jgi:hypothetical protein
MLASHHRRHDCAARPADTASNRPREGEPGYATSSAARDGFLHCRATVSARASDNLHRAPASLIQPCHDEARFRNGPTNYLGITNRLLVAHTARGPERESCGKDKCERLHQHFPRKGKYLVQFLTDGESRSGQTRSDSLRHSYVSRSPTPVPAYSYSGWSSPSHAETPARR